MFVGPRVIKENLVFYLDAINGKSYSSGTDVLDLTPLDNDGLLVNGVSYSGEYFSFDGTDDYISLGKSFISTGEIGSGDVSYTLEAWINYSKSPTGTGGVLEGCSIMGNASSGGIGMQLALVSSEVKVNFGARSTSNFNSVSSLLPNTWYHVVCTREVGNNNRIYINGQLDQTYTISYLTVYNTTAEMQIGWANTRVADNYGGLISVARLYNTFLTDNDVLRNFNAMKSRFGV